MCKTESASQEPGSFIFLSHHPQHLGFQTGADALMIKTLLKFQLPCLQITHLTKGKRDSPPPPTPMSFYQEKSFPRSSKANFIFVSLATAMSHNHAEPVTCKRKIIVIPGAGNHSRSWDRTTFFENMSYQFLNRSQFLISRNKELMAIEQGICSICHTFQCASSIYHGTNLLSVYVIVYFTRVRTDLSIY